MANERLEKMLVETIKSLLDQDDLGRVDHDDTEHSHNTQFQWEDIQDSFAVNIKDSDFFDAINTAFYKVHTYKWIEDEKFENALVDNLESMGIPHEEIEKAIEALEKVRKEYLKDTGNEAAAGWSDNMEGLKQVTQEPHNKGISDLKKDTMSGDNKPFSGAEPDNVRPSYNEA